MSRTFSHGIEIKKRYGQHFLRDAHVIERIVETIDLHNSSVFEIGCGDGALTQAILQKNVARVWGFEIDSEWIAYLHARIQDPRLKLYQENILDVAVEKFEPYKPWILLANIPYQITFPILHFLQRNRYLLSEGIIMIQEEVADKIFKTSGRGYGYPSLFFQRYFEWKKLEKIGPAAFEPPPKVTSRLLYFRPRQAVEPIAHEEEFWKFIKLCFHQPRRTLRNNLLQGHYCLEVISEEDLNLRAQQMSMQDLLRIWNRLAV